MDPSFPIIDAFHRPLMGLGQPAPRSLALPPAWRGFADPQHQQPLERYGGRLTSGAFSSSEKGQLALPEPSSSSGGTGRNEKLTLYSMAETRSVPIPCKA